MTSCACHWRNICRHISRASADAHSSTSLINRLGGDATVGEKIQRKVDFRELSIPLRANCGKDVARRRHDDGKERLYEIVHRRTSEGIVMVSSRSISGATITRRAASFCLEPNCNWRQPDSRRDESRMGGLWSLRSPPFPLGNANPVRPRRRTQPTTLLLTLFGFVSLSKHIHQPSFLGKTKSRTRKLHDRSHRWARSTF